MNHTP